jgi:hypothetical protein
VEWTSEAFDRSCEEGRPEHVPAFFFIPANLTGNSQVRGFGAERPMRTHQFGRKIKLRDNRHQTSDQNAGMALYDVEKSEAEGSRGQDHHLLDAVETRQIEYNGGLRLVD